MAQSPTTAPTPEAGVGFDWSTLDWEDLLADARPIPPGPESD